jgi:RNA polymerase sigma factor (sigma-70 family)
MALTGDGEAFGRLFDRHYARVRRHCARLVTIADDADDAAAIVFFEAWRNRDRVRLVDESVLPWLLSTATNVSRNQSRAGRRYRSMLAHLPPPPHAPDPADAERDGEALTAMRALNANHQQVLVLAVLEGYSERDIGTLLGLPVGTVKSRLSRARKQLAAHLTSRPLAHTEPELSHDHA